MPGREDGGSAESWLFWALLAGWENTETGEISTEEINEGRIHMPKKIVSTILCISMAFCSIPINTRAAELELKQEDTVTSIVDTSSVIAANAKSIQEILAQSKYSARQGHGFAAERGNNLVDRIKGKNAVVVGDNNVLNGPDRMISNRDGSALFIQTKYYAKASAGINNCFDNQTGLFRYIDADGNPMQIEVPKDQYDECVQLMRKRISDGKVPGVTNPDEAKNIVRKGNLTYKAAENLAKAGTIESLTYDAGTGVVTASVTFGISAVLNYAACRINGSNKEEAVKIAAEEGFHTGVLVFGTHVIASQLSKTAVKDAFKTSSEALVKACGKNFAESLVKVAGKNAAEAGAGRTVINLTATAAKALRTETIFAVVSIAVFTVPDAVDLFNGRISQKQFVKNFAVTAVSIVAGTAAAIGGGALGNLIVPGVGTIPGYVIGGLVGGIGGGIAVDLVADYITEDDAEIMYVLIQDRFAQNCEDYLVSEIEATNIVNELSNMLNDNLFKDMYQCEENKREQFVDNLLRPLFEKEVEKRPKIEKLTEEDLRKQLKQELAGVALIH